MTCDSSVYLSPGGSTPTGDPGPSARSAKHGIVSSDPWLYAQSKAARIAEKDSEENEFADWVMGFGPYQWFVTRTLDREKTQRGFSKPGLGTARQCLRQLLVYSSAKRFTCVFEMHADGVPHLHALIGGCRAIRADVAKRDDEELWGWNKWLPFKGTGGAPRYLGKYLGKDYTELYIGSDGPWGVESLQGSTLGGMRV